MTNHRVKIDRRISGRVETSRLSFSIAVSRRLSELPLNISSEAQRGQWDESYTTNVPEIPTIDLPKGGTSVKTAAVGVIQLGIPPETIKDSMRLGVEVPQFFIVPEERFCREFGDSLGINMAEFEFPSYFNYFVKKRRCTLIVDDAEAESSLRRVFGETLWGPATFRQKKGRDYNEDDFAEDYDREAIPNFAKELKYFRKLPGADEEFKMDDLINFVKFEENEDDDNLDDFPFAKPPLSLDDSSVPQDFDPKWNYSEVVGWGEVCVLYPSGKDPCSKDDRLGTRVEIFKTMYGKEYVIHDIDENNTIVGKAFLDGFAKLEEGQVVDGFIEEIPLTEVFNRKGSIPTEFQPPKFGLTVFGNSHGFDAGGSTSGYVLWVNGRGIMIDPPPYSSATLMKEGINPALIIGIILTHCHADHDAGAFVTVLAGSPVVIITTPTIYKSFITKYSALSKLSSGLIEKSHRNIYAIIGQPLHFHGAIFYFCYSLHSIPCICFRVELGGRSMVFTGDTLYNPPLLKKLEKDGILSKTRAKLLCDWSTQPCDYIFHEAGVPPIHTPISILKELDDEIKQRMYIVHTASVPEGCGLRCAPTGTAETLRLEPNTPHENFFETASSNFWFQLSLFSAIPFVTDLTYSATMDLLEVVRVKFFEKGAIVVPQARRKDVLCVIWEGTCHERPVVSSTNEDFNNDGDYEFNCLGSLNCRKRPVGSNEIDDSDSDDDIIFWSAGDWSGPVSLQPEKILCGESKRTRTHDIVAWSSFGVKAIFVEKTDLKRILQHSPLYKRFLSLSKPNENDSWGFGDLDKNQAAIHRAAIRDFNLSNLLALNSTLKKLKPVQKTHFQCLEGKLRYISPEECIGSSMENAFLLVSGTAELRENVPAPGSVAANARLVQENLKNEECSRIVGKQKCGFGAKLNGFHKLTQRLHHRAERMTKKKTPNSNNFTLRNIETLSNDLYGRRISRRKSVIDRNNNVLLSRMFLKNSITDGLIFSKGNFICNVLDMHSSVYSSEERLSDSNMLDSNMLGTFEAPQFVAGVDGCVVFEIPKESFIGFLGSYPGLFFSLLGTQAVI